MAELARARTLLGYEPSWKFTAGLHSFLTWAMKNELPEDLYEKSLAEMKQRGLLRVSLCEQEKNLQIRSGARNV
jgi:dTDP-L-rhamnose 4-epimerase